MTVKHDPPASYGDCFRVCVASVLDLPAEDVPHFCDGGVEAEVVHDRLTAFLRPRGLWPLAVWVRPGIDAEWIHCYRGNYICGGEIEGLKHCVIATGNFALVHDPFSRDALPRMVKPIDNPDGAGFWVWIFARLL